ncbi:DUF2871 domain-containing protein [Treponema brennaborense]|uniref:DUF2871 domain-containing protein n=1 Tax=Treponema brennaborense (strain DSM 12168 / CIP 105900 / DD5/3) TaxID=906968 RepID=F4LN29_TREBD|nr:DUF2871 domain-containing protein [Treponema brennaborense]AEE15815.1 hypothetical protein Trebr_0368 [Treponema brennaborense DSM 12168]
MKRLISVSFAYAIAAMCGGVFFREFTKFTGFTGITALSVVHTHLFVLGMLFFLIAALCSAVFPLMEQKKFRVFMITYNIGVPLLAVMLLIRGVFEVLGTDLSSAADAAVAGVAGLGHVLAGVGIIFFFLALFQAVSSGRN